MLSKIFSFFSGGYGKVILILSLVSTLTAFVMWGHSVVYSSGYTDASLVYEKAMSEQVILELDKAKIQWQIDTDKAVALADKDKEVIERVKTVYRDVYKTEYKCNDIGDNALELLNRVFEEKTK